MLWAIASKKNFVNLHSAAFDTVFGGNLSMPKNFAFFQKPLDKFFYKFDKLWLVTFFPYLYSCRRS